MNALLARALVGLLPSGVLLGGSIVLFSRSRTVCTLAQLLGAVCLVMVVLAHVFEALQVFPWMRWGFEHSAGHYLDLVSAALAFTLFPIGYFLYALGKRLP